MSYIPDCRTDEAYNEKLLKGSDKSFVCGFDYCTVEAVDSFFDNDMLDLAAPETYLGHVLCETVPENMQDVCTVEVEHASKYEKHEVRRLSTYADLIRAKLLEFIEMRRNELITSMIDSMPDE